MKKHFLFPALFGLLTMTAYTQTELGAEYQHDYGKNYHGNNLGGSYERFSNSGKNSWQIGVSYSFSALVAEKSTSGKDGINLSAGYRYGFSYGASGNLITGLRTTFFFTNDLKDKRVTFFIPTIELGYHNTYNHFGKGLFTTPSLGVGYNVKLNGKKAEEDYEGFIVFPRIAAGYRF